MPNVQDIRRRIKSVKSIEQITKAMKMVAAARLRKAQEKAAKAHPATTGPANERQPELVVGFHER